MMSSSTAIPPPHSRRMHTRPESRPYPRHASTAGTAADDVAGWVNHMTGATDGQRTTPSTRWCV
ncbi:hypothetical protein SBRY_90297 [Actinacidiphila bryophytorum]|uniref:Uncharacterized protein n=1 Tax=Actinacidiphila bryophytorum TaxID=1436133 RepID=A0A9W4MIG3_9ACTN|nr:hypothetical protein SBRY_90297 [Actinacidiphila bryophytorum]